MSHHETTVMLGPEYSWLYDYGAGHQVPEHPLKASTHACTSDGDMLASFSLSAVAQEESTTSTMQMTDDQLCLGYPALPVDQCIDFDSLLTDASFSSPTPNLEPAVVSQDVASLSAFPGYAPAQQGIGAESFYRNAASPPIYHQYADPAVVGQDANLFDTNATLSMQYTLDASLREELEKSILTNVPCVLEFGAGSVIDSEISGRDLQFDHEQTHQNEERLNKQDEKIRELELALQQLQQARPELPQAFVDIPRQWVEVQTNVEQYLKRFTDWAEAHREASADDAAQVKDRVKELEAEVRALRQCIDGSS